MAETKAFHANPKRQYHGFQCGEHDSSAQSQKEHRLLRESKCDTFDGQTLIMRKIMERQAFFASRMHQPRTPIWRT